MLRMRLCANTAAACRRRSATAIISSSYGPRHPRPPRVATRTFTPSSSPSSFGLLAFASTRPLLAPRRKGGPMSEGGEDGMTTPAEMMTPLGEGDDTANDVAAAAAKETTYRMVGGPNVPKTAAEWVRVAIAIRGADEVALVRCDVPAATSPPSSVSPSGASPTDSGIHYDEEGVAYTPMTRLQCMLRALVPHITSCKAGGEASATTSTAATTAASEEGAAFATTKEDISRYWNMLGGMFTSATPSVDVTVGGGGGNGPSGTIVTLHPLYCYASAVRLDPSSAPAWNNLGAELAQSPPHAAEEASRIINADSDGNVSPISVIYCFARAVELRPSHVGAWFNVCLGDSSVELRLPSSTHWRAGTTDAAAATTGASPSPTSKLKHSLLTVTREDCFVKALTAAREESYSLFLTGKSLLELPASRGGHFTRPFCVESAIVAALEEALAFEVWESASGTITDSAAPTPSRDAGALSFDTVALWYYAAECVEYTVNHNYTSSPPSSAEGDSAEEVARTIAIGGKRYTAQQCLVAALETVAEKQRVLLDRHSGTDVSVSPFTPLVWEALAKHVKGEDATVTIAGRSFSAEEVFTNQFET